MAENDEYVPYYSEPSLHRLRLIAETLRDGGNKAMADEVENAVRTLRDLVALHQRREGRQVTV